jgi:hypothetical protein
MMPASAYPALYRSADASAAHAQRSFVSATVVRLTGLAVAATSGAFAARVGRVDLFGVLALLAFLVALGAEIFLLKEDPARGWFTGRALAESAKTLAWRYIVGGAPFPATLSPSEADKALVARLRQVVRGLPGAEVVAPLVDGESQITSTMRKKRQGDLDARRRLYERDRIDEQRTWYTTRAAECARAARGWTVALVVIECAGGLAAAAKAIQLVHVDVLGLTATVGTALLGWTQAKQYRQLACAYGVAAQDLASVKALIAGGRTESEWARFVADAEACISREHTLWRSSRALPVRAR